MIDECHGLTLYSVIGLYTSCETIGYERHKEKPCFFQSTECLTILTGILGIILGIWLKLTFLNATMA